jgi:membrane-associated phospholipid phosphatase
MHATYFAYYPMILVPAIWLAARNSAAPLRRFVLGVMAAFIFCYLVFLILPVAGPYYEFARPAGSFMANPAAQLVYATLSSGSSYGAAFPSSHVAATIAALITVWAASRKAGLVMLIPALLLPVAVVYCQMHYAVDALSGLLVGLVAGWVGIKSEGRTG